MISEGSPSRLSVWSSFEKGFWVSEGCSSPQELDPFLSRITLKKFTTDPAEAKKLTHKL
jgi:hypothetical protein